MPGVCLPEQESLSNFQAVGGFCDLSALSLSRTCKRSCGSQPWKELDELLPLQSLSRVHISTLCLCGFSSCWPYAGLHWTIPTQVLSQRLQIHQQILSGLTPLFFPSAHQPSPLQASLSCLFGFCITAVENYKCFDPQCLEKRPKNITQFSGPNWSL